MRGGRLVAGALFVAGVACSASTRSGNAQSKVGGIALRPVATRLEAPLYLTAPPGDPRLFIVEQPGRVRVVRDGRLLPKPFLDLSAKVSYGGERGLLSVAFHPRYVTNGRFYVNYTDRRGDTRVERYVAAPSADTADPLGSGQDLGSLLGKLLRIDVDRGEPYAVPPDNPFVSRRGARPEIWALGLRNPWRMAFDQADTLLYIADVGQNRWEEVDVARADAKGLSRQGLTQPVLEYGHGDGCSIVGGYVYRGGAIATTAAGGSGASTTNTGPRWTAASGECACRAACSRSGRTHRASCTCSRPMAPSTASRRPPDG